MVNVVDFHSSLALTLRAGRSMSHFKQQKPFTINLSVRDRDFILQKIIKNKYKNINFNKLCAKFEDPECIQILYDAGFTKIDDRLLFSDEKQVYLEAVYAQLALMAAHNYNTYSSECYVTILMFHVTWYTFDE